MQKEVNSLLEVSPEEIESWLAEGMKKTIASSDRKVDDPTSNDVEKSPQCDIMFDDKTVTNLAKQYKVDESEIREKLDATLEEIKDVMPGETDEIYRFLTLENLGKKFVVNRGSLAYIKQMGTQFDGMFVGLSARIDANDMKKRECWSEYKKSNDSAIKNRFMAQVRKKVSRSNELNADIAKTEKYVVVEQTNSLWMLNEDGKWVDTKFTVRTFDKERVIPTYHKPTNDKGEPDPNFGKPIPNDYIKEGFYFDDSGELQKIKVSSKTKNVRVGYNASIWGSSTAVSNKPYKSSIRIWNWDDEEPVECTTPRKNAWALAEKLYSIWYTEKKDKETGKVTKLGHLTLSEVADLPGYGYYVLTGRINKLDIKDMDGGSGSYRKAYLTIMDDEGIRVNSSTTYQNIIDEFDDMTCGEEVCIMIQRDTWKNDAGEYVPKNILMGVIRNTVTDNKADALKRLADKLGKSV